MSSVYIVEPETRGKVVVNTTYGPLDIELWPKEAPKAVRNFVQLCLEGYYDNNIFHRIIKSFLVQTGDPTGTGTGGESIYGAVFSDEFHSRLRFTHRGLVACANANTPHSNGSQFFITLDSCDWLNKKNTIFGKVTGDSVFNLLRLGEVETDTNDRPLDEAPKILSVEVLWNPFEDIIPRQAPEKPLSHSLTASENKDLKKKSVKKLSLLSFGEEAEKEENELAAVKVKIKSSHDVLNDPRLLRENLPTKEMDPAEVKRTKDLQLSVRETLSSKKEQPLNKSELSLSSVHEHSDEDESLFDARMRRKIINKRQELGDLPTVRKSRKESSSTNDRVVSPPRSDNEDSRDQPKVGKLSLRKKGIGSEARAERLAKSDVDLQLLNHAEQSRHLLKQKKRRREGHEKEVLARLEKFKNFSFSKPTTPADEGDDNNDLSDWKITKLKFDREASGKDDMARKEKADDYAVHDPLLEKGKEKFNKMQAKIKRRDREWAGKSLT
ncbi:Peptidyl-prolyl cis-trans isomerase cyp57 [Thalictrum thalictroides]|uniref:Peptidyl-prolyl cis-trans isomerase cyp57 n=1 Tax=Thalictrum thalictroides TaxID=46969 RepID=A0A7J6X6T7_THATH|nr:Peptidyl-prolyl cis-trans isomerase cyp57 [Thalictrum thalictroides]